MGRTRRAERERHILALWECSAGLDRWARDDALLAPDRPAALGARNAALLALRSVLFPRAWPLRSHCPRCGEDCEFEVDSVALADALVQAPAAADTVVDGAAGAIALRSPTVEDLRVVAALPDNVDAAHALLARCISVDVDSLDAPTRERIEASLEVLDPGAVVSFALNCPACTEHWCAVVDVGEALWSELQRAAERALVAVDTLARAYGWSEDEVLALSPVRRAAYLQLVGAS
jgi:hypothetical protein